MILADVLKQIATSEDAAELTKASAEIDKIADFGERAKAWEVYMSKVEFLQDEFKNRDITNWKRVRTAIEHENLLTNHRLGWLFASQTFLFGGFGLLLNRQASGATSPVLLTLIFVISALASVICLSIAAMVHAADRQINRLTTWWNEKYAESRPEHPDISGVFRALTFRAGNPVLIPTVLFFAWLFLASSVYFHEIHGSSRPIVDSLITSTILFVTIGTFFLLGLSGENKNVHQ